MYHWMNFAEYIDLSQHVLEGPFDSRNALFNNNCRYGYQSSIEFKPYKMDPNIGKYYIVYVTHICSGNYCWDIF